MSMQDELTLEEQALVIFMRLLEPDVPQLRRIAREAARRAPVKLYEVPVGDALSEVVDRSDLEDRARTALRVELRDPALRARMEIDAAFSRALNRFVDEAVNERGREIADLLGVPVPDGHLWGYLDPRA